MSYRIDLVAKRAALAARREPYWHRIAEGRQLGYRKLSAASAGSWLARAYVGDRKYFQHPLGDFDNLPEKGRFDAARKSADDWFSHLDKGGSTGKATVKAACEAYVVHLRSAEAKRPRTPEQKMAAAADAQSRFERLVYDDPIGEVDLAKLTPMQMSAWKARVLKDKDHRGSFNRNAGAVRAAFNLALENRAVVSSVAWRSVLKPFPDADGKRELELTRAERRRLIEKASDEARALIRAFALLPLRPGDAAKLVVKDFDARRNVLSVPAGKTEARELPLFGESLAHVKANCAGKLPAAPIFARADGGRWDRFQWRDEVRAAAAAAKLPKAVCAYTLRHSAIIDLVVSGLDLFHAASMAGTSVKMIEKNYGHLRTDELKKGFEVLGLKK